MTTTITNRGRYYVMAEAIGSYGERRRVKVGRTRMLLDECIAAALEVLFGARHGGKYKDARVFEITTNGAVEAWRL